MQNLVALYKKEREEKLQFNKNTNYVSERMENNLRLFTSSAPVLNSADSIESQHFYDNQKWGLQDEKENSNSLTRKR